MKEVGLKSLRNGGIQCALVVHASAFISMMSCTGSIMAATECDFWIEMSKHWRTSHLMLLPSTVAPTHYRAGYHCNTSDADVLLEVRLFNIEKSHKAHLGCIAINEGAMCNYPKTENNRALCCLWVNAMLDLISFLYYGHRKCGWQQQPTR